MSKADDKLFGKYLKESQVCGLKCIFNAKNPVEKRVWSIIDGFLISVTCYIAFDAYFEFLATPTIIILENSSYSVRDVPFPSVSICNSNKISLKRAKELSRNLSDFRGADANFDELLRNVKLFGDLIEYEVDARTEIVENFQQLLYDYDPNYDTGAYFKKLTTPCEEFLVRCSWEGTEHDCADLFEMTETFEGFCCVFNNVHNTKPLFDNNSGTLYPESSGVGSGLSVTVYNDIPDYYYAARSMIGASVHVFDPKAYPDLSGGGLFEVIADNNAETFVQIGASLVKAAEEVIKYPISKRKCYFEKEASTMFGDYAYSDCFLECKVADVARSCGCRPFTIRADTGSRTCDLGDLPCLDAYKRFWWTRRPFPLNPLVEFFDELEAELNTSLDCEHCRHNCDAVLYRVYTSFGVIDGAGGKYGNNSIINVYFGRNTAWLYKQDVQYYWFEILSNFGNLFGIFTGISMIFVLEILYHCFWYVKKLCQTFRH